MESGQPSQNRNRLIRWILVYAIFFSIILLISNIKAVNHFISYVLAVIRPVTIGLILAYLVNPFFRLFEKRLFVRVRGRYFRRVLSLLFAYLLLFSIVGLLVMLIVPQLFTSIRNFVDNFDENLTKFIVPINKLVDQLNRRLPAQEDGLAPLPYLDKTMIFEGVNSLWNYLVDLFREQIGFSSINRLLDFLSRAASGLTNFIFGLFLSIYLLFSKEKRYAQIMKLRRAIFQDATNRRITHICTVADRSFGGFLRGKLLDSLIVGGLTFLACRIFNIPYSLLVATIVGITDFIPVIGPFIGVVPTALIILLTDPVKVIFFLLSIIVIQQLDGNIIAPKILGENTGVSSLCVMIASILMGGMWGFPGLLIGVPLFATVLELLDYWLENRLKARGLPNEIEKYYAPDMVMHSETAVERRRKKQAQKRLARETAMEDTGSGDLNLRERIRLRTYQLARKYHLFSDISEEDFENFMEEERAMVREHTEPQASDFPEEAFENTDSVSAPEPIFDGKEDGSHE